MWLQTGIYHLGGLYWLIAVAVVFVIAIAALGLAAQARNRATRAFAARTFADVGPAPQLGPTEDPRLGESFKILDERYARGEITREEFMERRADLVSTL